MFVKFSKESDQINTCPAATTLNHREEWTHQTHHAMLTNTEDSDSENEKSMMPLLIYLEDSKDMEDNTTLRQPQDNHEALRNLPYVETSSEPGPPGRKNYQGTDLVTQV